MCLLIPNTFEVILGNLYVYNVFSVFYNKTLQVSKLTHSYCNICLKLLLLQVKELTMSISRTLSLWLAYQPEEKLIFRRNCPDIWIGLVLTQKVRKSLFYTGQMSFFHFLVSMKGLMTKSIEFNALCISLNTLIKKAWIRRYFPSF